MYGHVPGRQSVCDLPDKAYTGWHSEKAEETAPKSVVWSLCHVEQEGEMCRSGDCHTDVVPTNSRNEEAYPFAVDGSDDTEGRPVPFERVSVVPPFLHSKALCPYHHGKALPGPAFTHYYEKGNPEFPLFSKQIHPVPFSIVRVRENKGPASFSYSLDHVVLRRRLAGVSCASGGEHRGRPGTHRHLLFLAGVTLDSLRVTGPKDTPLDYLVELKGRPPACCTGRANQGWHSLTRRSALHSYRTPLRTNEKNEKETKEHFRTGGVLASHQGPKVTLHSGRVPSRLAVAMLHVIHHGFEPFAARSDAYGCEFDLPECLWVAEDPNEEVFHKQTFDFQATRLCKNLQASDELYLRVQNPALFVLLTGGAAGVCNRLLVSDDGKRICLEKRALGEIRTRLSKYHESLEEHSPEPCSVLEERSAAFQIEFKPLSSLLFYKPKHPEPMEIHAHLTFWVFTTGETPCAN